jgi:hypothetical protein
MADDVIPFPGERRSSAAPVDLSSYTVRITLEDADPPIWRRVQLRSDLTLDRVHEVVQRTMGWQNSHLHQFVPGTGGPPFVDEVAADEDAPGIPERSVRLDQVLRAPGDNLSYEYDFGDGWQHTLHLEETSPYADGSPPATCLAGERACPPEDVGGIHHYNHVVEWLANTDPDALLDDPQLAETVEWLPTSFDPAHFDVAETNRILALFLGGPPPDVPNAAYGSLARHLDERGRRYLGELAMLADLRSAPPDDTEIAEIMRPYLTILGLVGSDGVPLTSAGYLPPTDTAELFVALGYDELWRGMGTREVSTPPVRNLRESAQALRLVRRHNGRLVRAPAGRVTADDPRALWEHVVAQLPLGRDDHERDAGVLMLLCLATGHDSRRVFEQYAGGLLELAGWSAEGHRRLEDVAFSWARPTWLAVNGVQPPRLRDYTTWSGATRLARAALLGPGPH